MQCVHFCASPEFQSPNTKAVRPLLEPFEQRAFAHLRKITMMKITHPNYVTLVIATHRDKGDPTAPTNVVGFAMLEIHRRGQNQWSFALDTAVADTMNDEPRLIMQLADILPMPKFLIGEAIDTRIMAPLDAAAERVDRVTGAYVRLRLARLQTAVSVDLSIGTANHSTPSLNAETPTLSPPIKIAVVGDKIIDPKQARTDLQRCAVNEWMRFLTGPRSMLTSTAMAATIAWISERCSHT